MRNFLAGLSLVLALIFAPSLATPVAAQPCQWNYADVANVATARYCGNVVIDGTLNAIPSFPAVAPNTVLAGPNSLPNAVPTFRALVGNDLPNPTAITKGGVESLAASSHKFVTSIDTLGVPQAAQPSCADLSDAGAGCSSAAPASGANPTATIGASAVNGVATTFMRSDAAPTLPAVLPAVSGTNLTNLNGSNIASGTVPAARGGAGAVTGALKANGAGTVSQAACADLSNAAASCSTDATNAANIASGTLPNARIVALPNANLANSTVTVNGTVCTLGASCSPTPTQQNTPYWNIFRSTPQTGLGTATTIVFDTAAYDTATSCNLTTGICRPLTAGLYDVFCQVKITEGAAPAAGNNSIATIRLVQNATIMADSYISSQVTGVANAVNTVQAHKILRIAGTNTAADDISCLGGADGTTISAAGNAGGFNVYMTGYRTGAQ